MVFSLPTKLAMHLPALQKRHPLLNFLQYACACKSLSEKQTAAGMICWCAGGGQPQCASLATACAMGGGNIMQQERGIQNARPLSDKQAGAVPKPGAACVCLDGRWAWQRFNTGTEGSSQKLSC